MDWLSDNRRRLVVGGVVALLAGLVLGLVLAGGADDEEPGRTATETATATTERAPERTERRPGTTAPEEERREERADLERTVARLVQAREETDAVTLCRLLGQQPRGTGLAAVDACARDAAVDLAALPTSDELSIEASRASGGTGTVRLAGGTTVRLRRAGGGWQVVAIESVRGTP